MVCNFVCKLQKNSHFCTTAENLVCYELYLHVQCNTADFHSLYILKFHGKAVVTI